MKTASGNEKLNTPGITATTLKWIALISMVLDHFAAVYLSDFIYQGQWNNAEAFQTFMGNPSNSGIATAYSLLRLLGRCSFPLYSFLIVEGLKHTRSRWRYALRLFLFACISEIPFDYGVYHKIFTLEKQNIFFTLLIGLLVIWAVDAIMNDKRLAGKKVLPVLLQTASAVTGGAAAFSLKVDYGIGGVLAILVIYLLQKGRKVQAGIYAAAALVLLSLIKYFNGGRSIFTVLSAVLTVVILLFCLLIPWRNICAAAAAGCILCVLDASEVYSLAAAFPVFFYNGEKGAGGKGMKWFFYLFYPLHLGLFILLRLLLGYRT